MKRCLQYSTVQYHSYHAHCSRTARIRPYNQIYRRYTKAGGSILRPMLSRVDETGVMEPVHFNRSRAHALLFQQVPPTPVSYILRSLGHHTSDTRSYSKRLLAAY